MHVVFQFDSLEQDVFEILHLIRSWRNTIAPINRIPPEILSLIPDFLDVGEGGGDVIALTHVCRAWRGVFTSRPALWVDIDLDSMGEDQALVYLERSNSFPINLSLYADCDGYPHDLIFKIIPQVIGRLKSLSIDGTPEDLQDITARLTGPAPLLEYMQVCGDTPHESGRYLVFTSTLFNGDLSSLRRLSLDCVHTELPWKNMVNLTSFALANTPPDEISVAQLLDFFENAPHLREVDLHFATPTPGAQSRRLVSLTCLKRMEISNSGPPSVLLDHLLIPVGAELVLKADLLNSLVGNLLPRSLDNLDNLSNFTAIKLSIDESCAYMTFSGPNGQVIVIPTIPQGDKTRLAFRSLAQLDISRTERFRIRNGHSLPRDVVYRALLPLKELRVLMLYRCYSPHIFIYALYPSKSSPEAVVCPKLEEVVLCGSHGVGFDVRNIIKMVKARASRGKKLKTIRIIDGWYKPDPEDMLELRRHVGHAEYSPLVGAIDDDL